MNPNDTITANTLETALATGKALGKPIELPGYKPIVIFPEGYVMEPLEHAPDKPLPGFITQGVKLDEAESFISYVTSYRQDNTRVFFTSPGLAALLAMSGTACFLAVLDYHLTHEQAEKRDIVDPDSFADDTMARRGAHKARFDCPLAIEWKTWMGVNGQALGQEVFIDFVEANSRDVVTPTAADIMEMAINFESASTGRFQNKINRTVTGKSLTFSEETDARSQVGGTSIRVPDGLTLKLPVFEGGPLYEVQARLVYTVKDGKLTIAVNLLRPHLVLRDALEAVREQIATELKLEVLRGGLC